MQSIRARANTREIKSRCGFRGNGSAQGPPAKRLQWLIMTVVTSATIRRSISTAHCSSPMMVSIQPKLTRVSINRWSTRSHLAPSRCLKWLSGGKFIYWRRADRFGGSANKENRFRKPGDIWLLKLYPHAMQQAPSAALALVQVPPFHPESSL